MPECPLENGQFIYVSLAQRIHTFENARERRSGASNARNRRRSPTLDHAAVAPEGNRRAAARLGRAAPPPAGSLRADTLGKQLEVHWTSGIDLQASADAEKLGRLGCLNYALKRFSVSGSVRSRASSSTIAVDRQLPWNTTQHFDHIRRALGEEVPDAVRVTGRLNPDIQDHETDGCLECLRQHLLRGLSKFGPAKPTPGSGVQLFLDDVQGQ